MKKEQALREIHADLERYLREDCYCPGEIYEPNGFFFQVFDANEPCRLLGRAIGDHNKYWNKGYDGIYVICRKSLLEFTVKTDSDTVVDSVKMDATPNNVQIFQAIIQTGKAPKEAKLDTFKSGDTEEALKEVMRMADAIIVS